MIRKIINYKFIVIAGCIVLAVVLFLDRGGVEGDVQTAQAVAMLLSRSAVSDAELGTAMKIPGVRDAYVIRDDGVIELPTRRRGRTIDEDVVRKDSRAILMPVGENHRVVVAARKVGRAPRSPIMMLLLCVAGGVMIVTHKRRYAHDQHTSVLRETHSYHDDECNSIDLELAARVADAALVYLDRGCRIVAASHRAQHSFRVKRTGGHLVDVLDAREAQSVLQLIRKTEKEGQACDVVQWNNASARIIVINDSRGYLIKLALEDSHE